MPDRGTKTRVYSSLPGARGDPNGHQSHCQKSPTQGHSQVNAQQVLVSCSFSCCHRTPPHLSLYSCSFWGKFGEQINKPTTVTVKDPSHLFSLLYDAAFDAITLRLCTDILEAVCMTMRSKALRPISSWQPSPPVTPGSNSMSL